VQSQIRHVNLLSKELKIRWQCLLLLRVATVFLQKGAAADLSLYDIASMMSRDEPTKPSVLEVVFAQAKTLAERKRLGGRPKRRSPPVSPITGPIQGKKGLRRSSSAVSLDLDAFKLPGVVQGLRDRAPNDDITWALAEDECDKTLFDDTFWTYLKDLMSQAILRRQMKRRAVESFKSICSPSKVAITHPQDDMGECDSCHTQ